MTETCRECRYYRPDLDVADIGKCRHPGAAAPNGQEPAVYLSETCDGFINGDQMEEEQQEEEEESVPDLDTTKVRIICVYCRTEFVLAGTLAFCPCCDSKRLKIAQKIEAEMNTCVGGDHDAAKPHNCKS